jgi:integrase
MTEGTTDESQCAAHAGDPAETRWEVAGRYRDSSGKQRARNFDRKTDARAFLATVKTDMVRGTWVDPGQSNTRLGPYAETWFASRLNLRRSTAQTDEGILRRHILPALGDARMGRITRGDVQTWVKSLSETGLGPESVRRCHRMLRAILADAVDDRIITESPCRRISLPRLEHREHLYLTAEEVERLAVAIDVLYMPLVYSAVYLGCRWGELVGLKRENLDLLRRQVRIVGTLEEVRGIRYVEETKTRTSRRNLSLPPSLASLLAEHLARAPASEFVFTGPKGQWLRRSVFRRAEWKPALGHAGLDEGLRFHDLRHSCAALLIAQGAHPKEIQARLGHASITTTLNTYGHLWPSLGAQLDEKIDRVLVEARRNVDSMWTPEAQRVVALNTNASGDAQTSGDA